MLHLVRHGQASFGAEDYDRLSALGERQCARLGEYWRERGTRFDAIYRGTLRRHEQSLAALVEGHPELGAAGGEVQLRPALNEYDSEAILEAIHPEPLPVPKTPEAYRAHFKLLREGLAAWSEARIAPRGMPSFADFVAGIEAVLAEIRDGHEGQVLIVSSGGPIATATARVLGAPAATAIELNLRIRNSAVTQFAFTPRGHRLHAFNQLAHLDDPALDGWETYT